MFKGNRFLIDRKGFLEEMFVDISYSTVLGDDGKVAGILSTSIESTDRALGERRLRTLKDLSAAFVAVGGELDVYPRLADVCAKNPYDIPFALLYLCDADGRTARLAAASGLESGTPVAPSVVSIGAGEWGSAFQEACAGEAQEFADLSKRFGPLKFLNEASASDKALLISIAIPGEQKPHAILVAGVSSYLQLNEEYREFLAFMGREIGAGISSLRALREAQGRADKLAEIDKAKTLFLSNVSHEFRTPLTLLLGPFEDLLSGAAPESMRPLHEAMLRNARRLLDLVNALLDFSRLEAGRLRASFEPTRLDSLTREIANLFESACLRAGLDFVVETPALPDRVYVDRDMWEKIVVNLLSNALKFTLRGGIRVSLRAEDGQAVLRVSDTGSGIPPKDLPHLFERFYRVPETAARTHEGAGIGLALVQELVALHGGAVTVESEPGKGSVFTVKIPFGSAHLPADSVTESERPFFPKAHAQVLETNADHSPEQKGLADGPVVLVVDDNPDMRAYLKGIVGKKYAVKSAVDGKAALDLIRLEPPALVLTDVMMPIMDGLSLLREIRADKTLAAISVILVSARAGEEASLEALSAGADDYLYKPFSAAELLARVKTHLELTEKRREAEAARQKDIFIGVASHEMRRPLTSPSLRIELLEKECAEIGSERLARRVASAVDSLRRLEKLMGDLFVVSTIQSGKLPFHPENCDLAQICRRAAEEEMEIFGRRIRLEIPEAPSFARVDPDRIFQLLENLISNALKFSPRESEVTLGLRLSEHEAELKVADQGQGIPPEHLSSLFECYFKVPGANVLSGSQVGMGLGLYIAKSIAADHGGTVEVKTEPGKGSEFTVRLPLAK